MKVHNLLYLKPLSKNDEGFFYMLKGIKAVENSFTNPVFKMSFEEYKEWLVQQEEWSRGENLPDGYVGQTIFWLMNE